MDCWLGEMKVSDKCYTPTALTTQTGADIDSLRQKMSNCTSEAEKKGTKKIRLCNLEPAWLLFWQRSLICGGKDRCCLP